MTKTLDLIKRFDRQVYYNTEPFERALTDNPSAKSFAIVVANNANGFAFVPVHLKRFIGNKTIIGTIERPEPNVDPYVQLQRTAERLLDAFDPKEQYHDDMKNIINMGIDDKYTQVFQALDILVEQATKKDETLEKQARDSRQRFLDSFTQYVKIQVETYRAHYDAEYKKNLTIIEYSIAMDDIGFKLSDVTRIPEPTLKSKIMGNIFIIGDWLDESIATMQDYMSYSDREVLIQMKLNALANATRLLVSAMNKATYTAFYAHHAEIMGLYQMLASPSNVNADALLDLLWKGKRMSNPKAKAIHRFSKQAFNHIEAFDKALNDYPKVQTFVIVATKDPNVFSFVPKQLERFAPDVVCLGTIDRPDADTASHSQLMQTALTMLGTLGPRYQFDSLVDSILAYEIHKNLVETFYLVGLATEHAVKYDLSWKDQAIAIANALRDDFMDMASRRLNGYKAEYEGVDLYRSLADLDITTVCGLPRITLDGEPINKDVIWSWIEKQGLSPDDKFYSKEIEERLLNLSLNNQSAVGVAIDSAIYVINKHQSDIDALSDLETKDQTS